jgi:hypothetical protein
MNHSDNILMEHSRNDVLLGRGSYNINNVGNIMFRDWCVQRKNEYNSTSCRKTKSRIAQEIVSMVTQGGGRFLREARYTERVDTGLTGSDKRKSWVLADKTAIFEKVKQTLREKQYIPKVKPNLLQPPSHHDIRPESSPVWTSSIRNTFLDRQGIEMTDPMQHNWVLNQYLQIHHSQSRYAGNTSHQHY